ncbi:hypothetical protein HK100_009841 [Physocladia obscura]|uniref:Nucleolus and neural progenitor protein-like N-terminal domain-containing protein n=1 Tax=Physocladia obscura TaxID=109957 RepID=A0AAD5XAX1_9FUNG|nr:hypothetical protein HK100_009841 [Physocladia obscura]
MNVSKPDKFVTATAQSVRHFSLLIAKSQPVAFATDTAILGRILYKNKSQHKSSKLFAHATKVYRLLNRIDANANIRVIITKVLQSMNISTNPKKYVPKPTDKPPNPQLLAELLFAISNAHTLHKHVITATRAAYWFVLLMELSKYLFVPNIDSSSKAVAVQTYFLPLCMTLMAICARLHFLSQIIMKDLAFSYQALYTFAVKDFKISEIPRKDGRQYDVSQLPDCLLDGFHERFDYHRFTNDLFDDLANSNVLYNQINHYSGSDSEKVIPLTKQEAVPKKEELVSELDFFSSITAQTLNTSSVNDLNPKDFGKRKLDKVSANKTVDEPTPKRQTTNAIKSVNQGSVHKSQKTFNQSIGNTIMPKSKTVPTKSLIEKAITLQKEKQKKSKNSANEIDDIFG